MKNIACTFLFVVALSSCQHKKSGQLAERSGYTNATQYPPPVVKADAEERDLAKEKRLDGNGDAERSVDLKLADPAPISRQENAPPIKSITADTSKKITKAGDIAFETDDVVKTRKAIIHAVQKAGGYIAEDNQSKDGGTGRKEYVLKVRVPAKNFDFLVDTVSSSAYKIDSKNIGIKDVTTEYIDMKTRLANKLLLEHSYLGLLTQAKRMADVLQIEDKVTEIRSDIESSQGELNYMLKQVAYSSLDITFYSRPAIGETGGGFGYKLKSAIAGGWDALQNLFLYLINIWPFVLIAVVIYVLVRRRVGKRVVEPAAQ